MTTIRRKVSSSNTSPDANNKRNVLILHNLRSRFNVGAIFRTADAAGIQKIFLCGTTPVPPHPRIDKVSLGAEKTVAFEYHQRTVPLLKRLKQRGYHVISLELHRRSIPYYRFRFDQPVALVVGGEVKGLSRGVLNASDRIIAIPMHGKKESLNVAIATGIVVFDFIHRM